jgi:hypothetical protein
MAPVLIREESTRVEGVWEEMYREALLQGCTGSVMRALSALDIALWDLNARSVDCLCTATSAVGRSIVFRHTPAVATIWMEKLRSISQKSCDIAGVLTTGLPVWCQGAAAPPSSFGSYSRELAGADGSVSERHNGAR